jgi:hypothetical protein
MCTELLAYTDDFFTVHVNYCAAILTVLVADVTAITATVAAFTVPTVLLLCSAFC